MFNSAKAAAHPDPPKYQIVYTGMDAKDPATDAFMHEPGFCSCECLHDQITTTPTITTTTITITTTTTTETMDFPSPCCDEESGFPTRLVDDIKQMVADSEGALELDTNNYDETDCVVKLKDKDDVYVCESDECVMSSNPTLPMKQASEQNLGQVFNIQDYATNHQRNTSGDAINDAHDPSLDVNWHPSTTGQHFRLICLGKCHELYGNSGTPVYSGKPENQQVDKLQEHVKKVMEEAHTPRQVAHSTSALEGAVDSLDDSE